MSKYTKGPWKVKEIEDNGGTFLVNCAVPRMTGGAASNGNSWVGTIWTPKTGKKYSAGHRTRTLRDYREAKGNAHLISACPDMYEFIVSLENDDAQIPGFMWDLRNTVLRKAEGIDL